MLSLTSPHHIYSTDSCHSPNAPCRAGIRPFLPFKIGPINGR